MENYAYLNEMQRSAAPIKVVRPNIAKVFVKNLIYVSGIAALIIGLIIYLDKAVGLDVFVTSFEALGVNIQSENIQLITMMIFLGLAVVYLVVNHLSVMNSMYEFYQDHIRICEPTLWVIKTYKEVQYKNIIKISYDYTGFMNKLTHAGEITIDVTGMQEGGLKMEMLDQTEELVAQLSKIVNDYRALQQMQFEENRKIGNIMRRF